MVINSAKWFGKVELDEETSETINEGTNFAFISILSNYGWIITISMTIAIILLCLKLTLNSIKIKENYGKYLVIAITSMLVLESIFSLVNNINYTNMINSYLPFVSWGGINLIIDMMCLGLVLSIYRRKDILVMKETMQLEKI